MVQLRASLEALVMQAWRDRWTELEWSINLKAALIEDSSELHKLCGLLLKQATLSEVPNKLMFNYLSYTLAAQVVPHSSFLEAVVEYQNFGRDQCVESILDLLGFVCDRLRCNSSEAYHCERFCGIVSSLVSWFATGMRLVAVQAGTLALCGGAHAALSADRANYFAEIVSTALAFLQQPFVSICLYFNHLQNPDDLEGQLIDLRQLHEVLNVSVWISDALKNDFVCYVQKLTSVGQLMTGGGVTSTGGGGGVPRGGGHESHPAAVTTAAVFSCVRITEQCARVADALVAVQAALSLPWAAVLRDFVRGAFLMQLDHGTACRESTATAFVYLKVPRVIQCLRGWTDVNINVKDIVQALEKMASFHMLFNSLDAKTRFHCFKSFLSQMKQCENILEADEAALLSIRERDRVNTPDHSPSGGQNGVVLVLKAEGTVHTLEKSFNSDFAMKHDKLAQMMSHMITQNGRSFDYICAASAATGKLLRFASKIHEFNKITERPPDSVESPAAAVAGGGCKDESVRAQLFDLTFLLLTRIKSLYTDLPLAFDSDDDFISQWNRQLAAGFPSVSSSSSCDEDGVGGKFDEELLSKFEALKTGTFDYQQKDKPDYGSVCLDVPGFCRLMLHELNKKTINDETVQVVFNTLYTTICSPLLCMIQCLVRLPKSPERATLTLMLKTFVDSDSAERKSTPHIPIDRWNFMVSTARPLLEAMLVREHYSCAPYSWLIQCARRSLPPADQLTASASTPPSADALRNAFNYSLRQGWVSPAVFALLTHSGGGDSAVDWRVIWVEEVVRLINADEMALGVEMCTAVSLLHPAADALRMGGAVLDYVMRAGHELYCVAPRGVVLARFLLQLATIALHTDASSGKAAGGGAVGGEEPKAKLRKMETETALKLAQGGGDPAIVATPNDGAFECETPEEFIGHMFERFSEVCNEETVRPALYLVANFLRAASEHTSGAAVRSLISRIPPNLVGRVIRIEPKVIGAPTVLALYDLEDRQQRQRALQNLCLLRQFGQL